jgi:hypothetical protein
VSSAIRTLQEAPGRLVQPLEMASYDAWIKQYRPDENSPNVSISYYTKGSLVGLLLDAAIRRRTGGAKSLDDVMRLAPQRYSGRSERLAGRRDPGRGWPPHQLHRISITLGSVPPDRWTLEERDEASAAQRAHLSAWLGGR